MIFNEQPPRGRTCPICTSRVQEDFLYTHVQTDLEILSELMRRNPSWVQPDGSCPQGVAELRASRDATRTPSSA